MEFRIPVDELQGVLSRLSNVVKVNENDITGQFLIEVGEEVKFKASDGKVTLIETAEECEIVEKGKVLLRLRDVKGYLMKFIPLVEGYGTGDFRFVVTDDVGMIKTKTSFPSGKPAYKTLKFEIFKADTFRAIKPFGEAQLIVNSNILKHGINRVLHCVNPAEVRTAITGVSITVREDKIIFAGTNGVKLSEFELDINADIVQEAKILTYSMASILRNVLDDDAQVFVIFDGRYIYVKSNNIYISGGLIISEEYPNYKSMFELTKIIKFPRIDFTDTIHSVMDVLDPEDNHRLTLNFAGNVLNIKNDRVESTEEFDDIFDADLDVDVNGEFLDSLLHDFMGEHMEIHFTEGNNYIVMKSSGSDKHTALLTLVKSR